MTSPKHASGGVVPPTGTRPGDDGASRAVPSSLAAGPHPSDCVCGHGPVWHHRYRECCADGCTCWQYRRHLSTNRNDRAAAEPSARS